MCRSQGEGSILDSLVMKAQLTLGDTLRKTAAEGPDRPALLGDERELTYGELDAEVDRVANLLVSLGVAVGDAVGRARARSAAAWRGMLEDVAELERRAKSSAGVDANDFALLAARWGP